ncbi:hypothetical protein [Ruminococcus difficilis]|uniref:hypothetical protein n=1 Tax=Ruminococcus difficilis TaxID=2763069 RepID=UPI001A9C31E0|nr:hypothetical protein [Ruminococcus difficilis]
MKLTVGGYDPAAVPPVYALVGTMNGWNTADTTYELTKNPGNDAEYMLLDFAADANTEFKVVKNGAWEAPTNNFTLNDAGTYDIYFRPDGSGNQADGWVDGKVFANNFRAPATYVAQIGETKYETLADAFAAAVDGDTITVLADSTGNGIKVTPAGKFADKGLTVDFNGHTYTVDANTVGSTGTETQAFQLLKDNKVTFQNGTIYSEVAKMLVQNYSNLTLDGMTLDGSNLVGSGRYTLSNNNGNVVINNSTIIAKEGTGNYAFDVCRYSSYPSVHVTVTGNSQINGDVEISASKGEAKEGFSLTLESGSMTGDIVVDASAQALVGDNNKVTKADTFTQTAPAGFKWVDNSDGTSTLAPIPYVAKIGDNKYETLEAAFAAAQDGDTITVLTDCAGNGIKAPQGKFATGLTVDFAGHTYTVSGTPVGSTGTETIGFQLLKDNKITFKGGTITGNSNENTDLQRMIQNYSDLTLENMTVSMVGRYYNQITVSTCNGKTVIKDSTISAPDFTWAGYDDPAEVGAAALTVGTFSSYPSIDVTVEGESTINGDINVSDDNNKKAFSLKLNGGELNGKINLDENAKAAINDTASTANVTKADTFTQAAPEDYRWVDNGNGTSTLAPIPYVAKIGNTKYETLADAFAAAQDGNTITLLADCAGNGIKVTPAGKFANGLTVDFAGHTYTVDGETVGSTGTETNGFQLLKNNKVTFKNGTITSAKAKILVQNYSDLTLEGMTLTLNNPNYTQGYTLSNNNGNIVIDGTTINANPAGGFAFDVCRFSSYPSVHVTVKGESEIKGDVEISASSGQAKDGFSLTLESGKMTGNIVVDASAQALVGKDNKVTKADNFTKEAPEGFEWVSNGNGTSTLAKVQDLFAGYSVSVGGTITMNVYINSEAIPGFGEANNNASATFTWDTAEVTHGKQYGNDTYTVNLSPANVDGNGYIRASVPVNAAQMANTITATVTVNDDTLDEIGTFSVKEYGETILADESQSETVKTLVKEMLNYGAMAQKVFESQLVDKPEKLANAGLSAADLTAIANEMNNVTSAKIIGAVETANGTTGASINELKQIGSDIGGAWYTTSVIFLDGNTIRHYFDDVNESGRLYDGAKRTEDCGFIQYVEHTDIAASQLDTLYTFSIEGRSFKYSVLDYAAAVLDSDMDANAKNLAKALYLYNQAANAYFG